MCFGYKLTSVVNPANEVIYQATRNSIRKRKQLSFIYGAFRLLKFFSTEQDIIIFSNGVPTVHSLSLYFYLINVNKVLYIPLRVLIKNLATGCAETIEKVGRSKQSELK
jgi:hypothetical protein